MQQLPLPWIPIVIIVPGLQEAAAKAFDEVLNIDKGIIPVVTED